MPKTELRIKSEERMERRIEGATYALTIALWLKDANPDVSHGFLSAFGLWREYIEVWERTPAQATADLQQIIIEAKQIGPK